MGLPFACVGGMCAFCSSAGCVRCLLGRERHSTNTGCACPVSDLCTNLGGGGCIFSLVSCDGWLWKVSCVLPAVRHMLCFIIHRLKY